MPPADRGRTGTGYRRRAPRARRGKASAIGRQSGMPVAQVSLEAALDIGDQRVAQLERPAHVAERLLAEQPGLARADAVEAHVRGEHRRLAPAHEQLGVGLVAVEAADVGGVPGVARRGPGQHAPDRGREPAPVGLRVAAPLHRVALRADPGRPREDETLAEMPLARPRTRSGCRAARRHCAGAGRARR